MTYDKYGNIKTRNGIAYTYGNSIWKDQLTGYGDRTISYDAQGNPVNYFGHTLTWEKGRQLKKYDSNTCLLYTSSSEYSYNIAAKRTVVRTTQVKDECEGETQDTYFKTVYTFDDDGNITGEYAYTEDTGNVQVSGEAGINPYMGDGGMSYIKGSDNRLINHNFTSLVAWNEEKDSCGDATILLRCV